MIKTLIIASLLLPWTQTNNPEILLRLVKEFDQRLTAELEDKYDYRNCEFRTRGRFKNKAMLEYSKKAGILIRMCTCGQLLGVNTNNGKQTGVSHGLCDTCMKLTLAEMQEPGYFPTPVAHVRRRINRENIMNGEVGGKA